MSPHHGNNSAQKDMTSPFDFSEIILNEQHQNYLENKEIAEGTGGSGSSEINVFSKLINKDPSREEFKKADASLRDSGFGRSSSHISYNFLPSNHLISFAHTNSGSKNHSEVNKHAQTINSNMRAPELMPPEAIHVALIDKSSKNKSIERPPSCGSLKGFIPSIPFEHRKFSIESLKSRELIHDEASVGSVDLHKNAENYTSKILIKSDR